MASRTLLLAAALATVATAHPALERRNDTADAAVPVVTIPLSYQSQKVYTELVLPWDNTTIEVVFDSGSENFWVFGPNSTHNWGCTGLFCTGHCNEAVTPFYDWPSSPTAADKIDFTSYYSYGFNTKYTKGDMAINDTFTFVSASGLSSTVENVRVAIENYMSERLYAPEDSACHVTGFDESILGTAPFYRTDEWNTTGPHVRQELLERGVIKAPVQSMWFDEAPEGLTDKFTGNAVFGGIDKSKYSGPLVKVPVLKNSGLGASVGYFVSPPTVSVNGQALAMGSDIPASCHIDSGTQADELPVSNGTEFMAALGLVNDPYGRLAWPVDCDDVSKNATIDLIFPALGGQDEDRVTVKMPFRNYISNNFEDRTPGYCVPRMSFGGCMLGAPFATAAFFAADDAAGEIALAQGGVSARGSAPDLSAMSLTIS